MLHRAQQYLKHTLFILFNGILILGMLRFFIVEPSAVSGQSMESTLQNGERLLVLKFPYFFSSPQRGDLVQLYDPQENLLLVKRVIGLPGETVLIRADGVFVDFGSGPVLQSEPYLDDFQLTRVQPGQLNTFVLSEKEYYVLGDNRLHSYDSRNMGAVSRNHIFGKIWK